MLTKKQHELLKFIHSHLEATGCSPSFDEMKVGLQLRSKSGIHRLITALEERGFLRRRAHRARALEIIRMPNAAIPVESRTKPAPREEMAEKNFDSFNRELHSNSVNIPLVGRIAAGIPIEAFLDQDQSVSVPVNMISSGEHYALQVLGESMIEAGILSGDTVIIRRGSSSENGDIVVALIDENEVTLKKIWRRGNSIALEAANLNYKTRIFGPDQIKIQGKLVGLLRNY